MQNCLIALVTQFELYMIVYKVYVLNQSFRFVLANYTAEKIAA